MTYTITVAGMPVEIISDVNISRSCSDLITSCSFSVSADIIDLCRRGAVVIVKVPAKTVFIGVIFDYQIQYQGSTPILNVNCADAGYSLSHSDLSVDLASITSGQYTAGYTYSSGMSVGDIIESVLTNTGLSATGINARDVYITSNFTVTMGQTRKSVIDSLCAEYGCIFFVEFVGDISVAVCDKWDAFIVQDKYSVPVAVSDASHLIETCTVESIPNMNISRMIVYGDNPAGSAAVDVAVKPGTYEIYVDGVITVPVADWYAGVAQDYLDLYELCDEICTVTMQGMPLILFGQVDLYQYFYNLGISSDITTWRVIQEDLSISGTGGVVSVYRLANPAIDLSVNSAATAVATLTSDQMWEAKRETSEYAEVIE